MLASVTEAEDLLQEVWLRWQRTDHTVVVNPPAFLAQTTTRLAINHAQSARVRRETYVGPWLPEPVDTSADPGLGAERGEALELAVLLLLEKLPPVERAAYVLREAFDYSFAQIAEMLGTSEVNARQLATRARKHLSAERRTPVSPVEQRRLLEAFLAASQAGDHASLQRIFTADVVSLSDGGGAVRAARKPVVGSRRVVHMVEAVSRWVWTDATLTWVDANGFPALFIHRDGAPFAVLAIRAAGAAIDQVFWIMHPAKIAGIAGVAGRARAGA
jgi:RNA polymerase sigma-70 factor (ECF subfamily)